MPADQEWFDTDLGPDVDDELELTNYLLAQLVEAQTGEDVDDLGYFGGGSSAASAAQEAGSTSTTAEEQRTQRSYFGGPVDIAGDDTKDDPVRVDLPFDARLLDLRQFTGTVHLAVDDPTGHGNDDTRWVSYDDTEEPIGNIPIRNTSVWLATDSGVSATPTLDAWRHRAGGGDA